MAELYLAIWLFDIPHSLGGGDHVEEDFLPIMANNHIWFVWELVVIELNLLVILLNKVVLKSGLMVNACHGQTSGDTENYSLLEWVIVGPTLLIPLLMQRWMLN